MEITRPTQNIIRESKFAVTWSRILRGNLVYTPVCRNLSMRKVTVDIFEYEALEITLIIGFCLSDCLYRLISEKTVCVCPCQWRAFCSNRPTRNTVLYTRFSFKECNQ